MEADKKCTVKISLRATLPDFYINFAQFPLFFYFFHSLSTYRDTDDAIVRIFFF